jgi:hypothetical protein
MIHYLAQLLHKTIGYYDCSILPDFEMACHDVKVVGIEWQCGTASTNCSVPTVPGYFPQSAKGLKKSVS